MPELVIQISEKANRLLEAYKESTGRHLRDFRPHIRRDLVDYAECCAMCLLFPRHLPTTSEDSAPSG